MVSPLASDCFLRWICSTVLNEAFKDGPLENSFCRSFSQYFALQALTTFISPVSQFDSLNLKRTFTPLCHGWTLSLSCNIRQPKASLPLFFMYQWSLLLDIQGPESHYFIYFSDFLSCIKQGNKANPCYSIIDVIRSLFIQLPSVQSVQLLSRVRLFAALWITACQASLSITSSQNLLKLMSIELVITSSHLTFCQSLLLLPPILPSIRIFSNASTLRMRWLKYWSFSFSISPSNEHPGLISFRIDWLDLLAVQGTLKSLLQHHSSKASTLQYSTFLTVQLSHPYMTTGKTIALTRRTFVGKVMSLLFNMLSRLVVTFLPRSKHLLISWLQSPSSVILEPPKIKSDTVSTVSPYTSNELP